MGFGSVLALAIGLSMDAMAVAAARGLASPEVRAGQIARIALLFGGFQALMPLLGWAVGTAFGDLVRAWDHWIAFVLLGALGLKMLWEARGTASDDEAQPAETGRADARADPFAVKVLVVLAIATSIDALAAGVTLPMFETPMLVSIATIGVTTAVLSAIGVLVGRRFGALLGKRLEIVGGLALVGLGTKILLEHVSGAG